MPEPEDEALAIMRGLTLADRSALARDLPRLLEPVLRSLSIAAATAADEPVGAVGHVAHASALLRQILLAVEHPKPH